MAVSGGLNHLEEQVCSAVAELAPGPLVVALSGGADSAVVAWACVATRPSGSIRAIHVDHGWEGSPLLRQAAVAIADRLNLPLEVVAVTPRPGASREGAARIARLGALVEAAKGQRVVFGHHADDAAETVIGNLLRGAGLTGLSGIAPDRAPFVRPLLGLRRSALRRLAEELELPFADDPSNADTSMRRNLIRHEILPWLDRHITGDLVEILARSSEHLATADGYLEEMAPALAVRPDEDAMLVAVAPLLSVPEVLAAQAVRRVLRTVHPPYPGTSREVAAVLAVVRGDQPRDDLVEGLIVEREGPYVAFYHPRTNTPPDPHLLPVPGEVTFGSHLITAEPAEASDKLHMSHDRCRVSLGEPDLLVRAAKPGDVIDIGGGSKAVSDALNEAVVPVRKRPAWPVVEHRGTIIWVAGVRVAPSARSEAPKGAWIELERRNT